MSKCVQVPIFGSVGTVRDLVGTGTVATRKCCGPGFIQSTGEAFSSVQPSKENIQHFQK